MNPKIIKTDADYQAALIHLENFMNALPGSPEEEELELFAMLIDDHEAKAFPIGLPNPIAAIKFRMEQQELTPKDLEKYIGSQSKVSEILNGKRPLSLAMIRALHAGLDIPAEVLLQAPDKTLNAVQYNYRDYPFTKMVKRGYFKSFSGSLQEARLYAEDLLTGLFTIFQGDIPEQKLYCRNSQGQVDELALCAWQARALTLATEQNLPPYQPHRLTEKTIQDMVKLSGLAGGPVLAQEWLQQRGIPLVILPHLPQTYLDGACFKAPDNRPVIGLTLRHNRLDNFWFTLVHELAHVLLHLDDNNLAFFDDTERGMPQTTNPQEVEANTLSANLLIPIETWKQKKNILRSKVAIITFAQQLSISPAIVAGRLRWEANNYNNFGGLLGRNAVRKLFTSKSL